LNPVEFDDPDEGEGMRTGIIRAIGVATAVVALASSAQAQGKGHGRGHNDANGTRDVYGDIGTVPGRRVPPGLAKKPGQMPPGQYKKVYGTNDGASVLSDILRRRGYTVTRLVPYGTSQYVYYRRRDGSIRRAIVSPGTNRLSFSNVPSSILQEVLSRLY
jgi:hypothetical protein